MAVRNLRDIGGLATLDGRRTRWHTVLRGGCPIWEPSRVSDEPQTGGLRTSIDLRETDERTMQPDPLAAQDGVDYRWCPVWDGLIPSGELPDFTHDYERELNRRGERLVQVCRTLLGPQ